MNLLLTIISFLYAGTGIVAIIGYLPTIKDLLYKKQSANINSYVIWSIVSTITFLYALLVISDLLLELITGLILISNVLILILTLRLKYKK
ncbi:MAG: hypothetical protein WC438_00940 [Candidatus Pacearchaeota archaeon]